MMHTSSIGPAIDTRSYVDTESFRHLEDRSPRRTKYNRDASGLIIGRLS
ncbi:unnamed protein product, partial [Adineta steineri]